MRRKARPIFSNQDRESNYVKNTKSFSGRCSRAGLFGVVSRRYFCVVAGDMMGVSMEVLELELPSFWACALVNDDESGLESDELKVFHWFESQMLKEYSVFYCVDVSEESWFQTCHDATRFGVLACEVSKFSFAVKESVDV